MGKKGIWSISIALFFTILASCLFCLTEFDVYDMVKGGFGKGDSVRYLEDGWSYCVNGSPERLPTTLPAVLTLPEDAKSLTFYNTIPETVKAGDVLRLQTIEGVYRIFVDGKLLISFGTHTTPQRYLFDCASALLIGELNESHRGKELRIETESPYPLVLAVQRAPQIGNHRDLLMSDTIDSASGLIIIVVCGIFAFVLFLQYILFLLNKQHFPVLLLSVLFLVALILYCNVGTLFRGELWGYPEALWISNDFNYYALQAFIPILGYLLFLICLDRKLPKALGIFIGLHTVCAILAVVLQMLWIISFRNTEYLLMVLTLVGYVWLFIVVKPYRIGNHNRWFITPVFFCILACLLDYYKAVGVVFPFPESFVVTLQLDLPFMVFLPIAMPLYGLAMLYGMISMISEEKSRLVVEAETGRLQAYIAEKEYLNTMQSFTQIRQLRHDMTHHFSAIGALAREDDTAGILSYLQELSALAPSQDKVLAPGNFITNSFLSHYSELCEAHGIKLRHQISFSENQLQNKAHLGILLGNALQNAYEAVCKQPTPDSFIEVVMKRMDANLIFIIRNSYTGIVKKDFRTTKATQGHGVGLASMGRIVELYNGYFNLDYTDGVFTVNIVLGLGSAENAKEVEHAEAGNL